MKNKWYIFVILIVVIIGISVSIIFGVKEKNKIQVSESNDEEQKYLNENSIENTNIVEYGNKTEEEYYLHDSNLELPSDEECNKMHKKIIEGLTEKELLTVSKQIRIIHNTMESLLVDGVWTLKNPESEYWILYIDSIPIIEDTGDGLDFSDEHCFKYVLNNIKKIENILKDKNAKITLYNLYLEFENALKEHNLEKCFEVHKTIHDFDYFIINHPVNYRVDGPAPLEWNGIYTYFGTVI